MWIMIRKLDYPILRIIIQIAAPLVTEASRFLRERLTERDALLLS